MGYTLRDYQNALRAAQADLALLLARGDVSVSDVAIARTALDLMDEQLLKSPAAVVSTYGDPKPDPQTGAVGPRRWRDDAIGYARRQVYPLLDDKFAEAHRALRQAYYDLALRILNAPFGPPTRVEDNVSGVVYLVRPNQQLMKKLVPVIASELMDWFDKHRVTPEFLKQKAETGFYEFLLDRPSVKTLMRLVDEQPVDVTSYDDPSIITAKSQTAAQAIIEIAISLVPVVGEAVAAYEFFSGVDLFGNKLDAVDRGVLGASIILPVCAMAVRDGRALYTETRLVALYGSKASEWERALNAAGRVDASSLRVLDEAEAALRLERTLAPDVARRAAAALPGIAKPTLQLQSAVDKVVSDAFAALKKSNPIFATLDEFSVLRMLEKGPNVDLIKGQMLEELIESRLVPWLADPNGYIAFGFKSPIAAGSTAFYLPGHMISDINGRQITDGILATWENGELRIHVVFEAKAGKSAARELRLSKGGLSSLSATERAELRAEAQRAFRTLKRRAELQGLPFKETLDSVEAEILDDIRFSETGGQIRRDVERLFEDVNGNPSKIYVGDRPHAIPVRISPTRTKFFGVLPRDVDRTLIQADLQRLGYDFEIIGVDISQRDLKSAADPLVPLAQQIAPPPPPTPVPSPTPARSSPAPSM